MKRLSDLETPQVVVDLDVLERNIARMAGFHQPLDQGLHFLDMLGRPRLDRRFKTAKRCDVGLEIFVGLFRQLTD